MDELDRVLPPDRLGRYRIVERLGAGGMGEVLLAIRSGAAGFKKPVALKRILPQLAIRPERLRQIQREASLAAMLHHPNCVHVSELEEIDGELLIAMELLFGVNLHELSRRAKDAGEQLPLGAALRIIADGARGLHAVHSLEGRSGRALGVVHGDVSPQNLFVTDNGVTKLLDFGVSSSLLAPEFRETDEGMLKGKFPYMAPEQFDSGPMDARVDVWALGVTLWEITCGQPLFDRGSPIVTMDSVHSKHIPHVSQVRDAPAALDQLVLAALERDPSRRLSSTLQLAEQLEDIMQSLDGSSHADVAAVVDRHAKKAVRRLKRLALSLTQDARVSSDTDADLIGDGVTTPDLDLERIESTRPPARRFGATTRRDAPGPEPIDGDATKRSQPPTETTPNTPRSRLKPKRSKLPQLPSAHDGQTEDEAPTAVYWEGPTLLQPESDPITGGPILKPPPADAPTPLAPTPVSQPAPAPPAPRPSRAAGLLWDLVWLAVGAGTGWAAAPWVLAWLG